MNEFDFAFGDIRQADGGDLVFEPAEYRIGLSLTLCDNSKTDLSSLPEIMMTDFSTRNGKPFAAAAKNLPDDAALFLQILRGMQIKVNSDNTDNHA